ncbi:MAG: transporter substrate-binding domain-containing protein [Actinomycetota bacterium]
MNIRLIAVALCVCVPAACGLPRDPEGTLERVVGGTLRVGVAENPPWVVLSGPEPSGVEVALVERFAAELDAEIEYFEGSVEELAAAVHVGELDLLIAGLEATSSLSSEIALTHPYHTTQLVIAAPENIEDIAGVRVSVERGTEGAGLVEKQDAIPIQVDDITGVDGAVAIDNFLVDDLDLVDSGVRLLETDHVMATRHGENAFITRLERFLLEHKATLDQVLEEMDMLR